MDLEDRVLEFALERHFSADSARDHSRGITRRWQAGASGSLTSSELEFLLRGDAAETPGSELDRSELDRSELDRSSDRARDSFPSECPKGRGGVADTAASGELESPSAQPRARLVRVALMAACIGGVVLGFAIWRSLDRTSFPEQPFGTTTGAVRILRGEEFVAREGRTVKSGDTVLVTATPVTLALQGGVLLHARSTALFQVAGNGEELSIEVLDGELRLEAGSEPLRLSTLGMGLHLAGGARVRMEFVSMSHSEEPGSVEGSWGTAALRSRFDSPDRAVYLTSLAGTAVVQRANLDRRLPPDSDGLRLARDTLLSESDWLRFLALEKTLLPAEYRLWNPRLEYDPALMWKERRALAELLGRVEGLWGYFERRVTAAFALPYRSRAFLPSLLDALLVLPHEGSFALARGFWIAEPRAFAPRHIVALAERGAFEFEREVRARVEFWGRDDRNLEEAPFLSAAFLALRGEDAGRVLLEEVLDRAHPAGLRNGDVALAALGLERLGVFGAWEQAARRTALEAQRALRRGDLRVAANLALTLETAGRLGWSGPTGFFPGLREAILAERSERSGEFASEAEIRAILDEHASR